MAEYDWLEKRTPRAVDQLRLWADNPRLDPVENHVSLVDYVSDLIAENAEKESFLKLIDSIATDGYIPADPVVVWKNEANNKYYVAEGNRRALILKLLRNPDKAPKSIRPYIRRKSELIDRKDIEKIKVCIAPSFEACEWYINQRHSSSSIQRRWSRLQQQRWIAELYDKYNGNINLVASKARLRKSELDYTLRILHIRDLALNPIVLKSLTPEEQDSVKSHRIPITIFERWFVNPVIKEKWGIEFDEDVVNITSNEDSFLNAYAAWIKLVVHRDDYDVKVKVNTRSIDINLDGILACLPEVSFGVGDITPDDKKPASDNKQQKSADEADAQDSKEINKRPINKNPDRNNLVVDTCQLKTQNYKLDAIFREFKIIPFRYRNCVAASLRVFLDLAVREYIASENCEEDMRKKYNNMDIQYIVLQKKLEYLKKNKLTAKTSAYKVVDKLLNPSNHYSLDTLNNYIHGSDTHHTEKRFLNGFWDFLVPLFEEIIDIKAP